jgi:hypothetical protein
VGGKEAYQSSGRCRRHSTLDSRTRELVDVFRAVLATVPFEAPVSPLDSSPEPERVEVVSRELREGS